MKPSLRLDACKTMSGGSEWIKIDSRNFCLARKALNCLSWPGFAWVGVTSERYDQFEADLRFRSQSGSDWGTFLLAVTLQEGVLAMAVSHWAAPSHWLVRHWRLRNMLVSKVIVENLIFLSQVARQHRNLLHTLETGEVLRCVIQVVYSLVPCSPLKHKSRQCLPLPFRQSEYRSQTTSFGCLCPIGGSQLLENITKKIYL